MATETKGERPERDSDYDGAWNEAMRHHLTEFLAVYLPDVHAAIDWSTPVRWFDKELSQILGTARRERAHVTAAVGDEQP